MKNYEEMAESVLERRDRYVADRKRKMRKAASAAAGAVSGFCLIAVLGTGVWYAGILNHDQDISDGQPEDAVNDIFLYTAADSGAGEILPGGATVGDNIDNGADHKKEMQQLAGNEVGEGLDGDPAGYSPLTTDASSQRDEISETDPLDTNIGTGVDRPVAQNPGSTGALTAYEAVWGGSYPNEAGQWVVLLTENTAENREKVFQLNPTLNESNTVFEEAAFSYSYLVNLMESLSKADLPSVVSSIGFKEERNRIAVYLTADDASAVAEILAYDTIGGAIEIINCTEFQPDKAAIKLMW